jgi:hypothetical protein
VSTRYGAFTYRAQCRHCGQPLPVNFPSAEAHCTHCLKSTALAPESFGELLHAFDDRHRELVAGQPHAATRDFAGLAVTTSFRLVVKPLCEKCGATFPDERIADGETRNLFCASCGDPASTAKVPAWLAAAVPQARQILSVDPGVGSAEGAAGPPPEADHQAARPIVMSCPQCGGTLRITAETDRVLPCQFCTTEVYLPDPIWLRLHPARTVREWFVRFEGATRPELAEARRQAEDAHRSAAAAAAGAAQDAAVDHAKRRALVAIGALYAAAILVAGVALVSWQTDILPPAGTLRWWACAGPLGAAQLGAGLVAITRSAEVIRLRTKGSNDHLFSWVWIWVLFGIFPFPFGPIVLVVGLVRVFGSLGASVVTTNGRRTNVEAHTLRRGEGVPLGLFLIAQAVFAPTEGFLLSQAFAKPLACRPHRTAVRGAFRPGTDAEGCVACGGVGQLCCDRPNQACGCDPGLKRVPREGTCR